MKKSKLNAAVKSAKEETRTALQTMYDAMNNGQRKQIVKDDKVKQMFEHYGVKHGED